MDATGACGHATDSRGTAPVGRPGIGCRRDNLSRGVVWAGHSRSRRAGTARAVERRRTSKGRPLVKVRGPSAFCTLLEVGNRRGAANERAPTFRADLAYGHVLGEHAPCAAAIRCRREPSHARRSNVICIQCSRDVSTLVLIQNDTPHGTGVYQTRLSCTDGPRPIEIPI